MIRFLKLGVICMFMFPNIAVSQSEMVSLSEYFERPEDRREVSYVFLRCAGLFGGVVRYGGANLSEEISAKYQSNAVALLETAVLLRLQDTEDADASSIVANVGEDYKIIEGIYLDRMQSNYRLYGEVFDSDQDLLFDLSFCGEAVKGR